MNTNDPWRPFSEVMNDPWKWIRDWKAGNDCKVIGHLLPDTPEEIIHASGAVPFAIEGAGVPISHGQAHIPSYTCSHAMGALEMALRGDMDCLDGMVIPYVCDTTRNLFHIWQKAVKDFPCEFLRLPKRLDFKGVEDYIHAEFSRLLESIGSMTGQIATESELAESIKVYNNGRQLMRRAFHKYWEDGATWTFERIRLILASALVVPIEEHIKWMEALPWDESESGKDRHPVYAHGKVWDPPELAKMLDDLDLMVAGDDMVTGYRSVAQDAAEDITPMEALVKRHLSKITYTGYHVNPYDYVTNFVTRVKDSKAKGVIFLNPKFCEAAAFDTPDFQKALESEDIPSLLLETSSGAAPVGQIKLRLEAFQEMITSGLEY